MALYCRWAWIINIKASTRSSYNRADATALCGKILMMGEEELDNSCDRSVPAINPGPVVLMQIWLQKPHKRGPSLVVLSRGGRNENV
jgi:hypothetical protein